MADYRAELRLLYPGRAVGGRHPDDRHADDPEDLRLHLDSFDRLLRDEEGMQVHRAQLMEQWKERLAQFLAIDDVLPPQPRRRGRQKKREIIGCYGAGRDTRSGMIDIAMLQSMGNSDEIQPWIHDYGMVIVDECHHVPAVSFEQVLKAVSAKYVYGLTATPKRQDGHHPILYMYLGSIRYQVDARLQAEKRPFAHLMIPRFTGMRFHLDENSKSPAIVQYYDQIMLDDLRNHQIVRTCCTAQRKDEAVCCSANERST